MPPLLVPFLGFSIAVTAAWFKHHFFVLNDNWLVVSFPFVAYGISLGLTSLWLLLRKRPLTFSLPRFVLIGVVGMVALLIFNAQVYLIGILPDQTSLLPLATWQSANLSFLSKLGAILVAFTALTTIFAVTGDLIIRRVQRDTVDNDGYWFFIRLAIGVSLWVGFLLALGMLGSLNQTALSITVVALLALGRQYLLALVRWCAAKVVWTINPRSSFFILIAIGIFILTLNLTEAIRPDPVGYDDMTAYMNRSHLMAENGALLPGGSPFPFELLSAGIQIGSGDGTMFFALSLGTYALILGGAILYAFGQTTFSSKTGLIAGLIALSLPMGPALALAETKPDSLLFPVATLFFWSLLRWLKTKNIWHHYFSLFLLGFAISIKLSALFLIAPLLISIGIVLMTARTFFPISFPRLILAGALFLLPLLPWIWYGANTRTADTLKVPSQLLTSGSGVISGSLHEEINSLLRGTACRMTGAEEDFARFENQRGPVAKYFFLPWDLTMNLTVTAFATEIGFLFLAILPIWLIPVAWPSARRPIRIVLEEPLVQLAVFTLGYFVLWIIWGQGIIWYAYPIVALLSLQSALAIEKNYSFVFLSRLFFALLIVGLVSNTLVRMKFSGAHERLRYAAGTIGTEEFLERTFPGLYTLKSALNANPDIRVYVTGSRLWYAIDNNQARAYMDGHLDAFDCLLQTNGPEEMQKTLRALNIRYIFFSRTLLQELRSEKNPSFHAKVDHFTDFAGKYLRVVWGSQDYMLFELPVERK